MGDFMPRISPISLSLRMVAINKSHKQLLILSLPVIVVMLNACSYSSRKIDYPLECKYASISIEYDGIADSLKTELADSIYSCIRKTDFTIVNIDSLNEEQRDSLLLIKADLYQDGAEFAIGLSFYPYRGIEFTEIYLSSIKKEDPLIHINAASSIPFSENYNRRKAFKILNNGFITKGGVQHLFSNE